MVNSLGGNFFLTLLTKSYLCLKFCYLRVLMAYSQKDTESWSDVINAPPDSLHYMDDDAPTSNSNSALYAEDDDSYLFYQYSLSTINTSHKRSNSLNNFRSHQLSPRRNSSSPSAASLLPCYMSEMLEEEEQNPTMDLYDSLLEKNKCKEASELLSSMISSSHDSKEKSKIYRAAANSSKRFFFNNEACKSYEDAEAIDPDNAQNYIDHAKFLDEIGKITEAESVLQTGLEKTNMSDSIFTKLIKQFERRQKFDSVRSILGRIYENPGFQKSTAPAFAEGTLFESRHGNIHSAILAFEEISQLIPIKNNFYAELSENIKRRGFEAEAFNITKAGVDKFPTTPNNWCQLLQLQTSIAGIITTLRNASDRIVPLMMPKLEQTAAVMCASLDDLKRCREIYSELVAKVPSDQKWRIYYNAAIVELFYGDSSIPVLLLDLAASVTPEKFAPITMLAIAKMREVSDDIEQAMKKYDELIVRYSSDWRVYLEKSMFFVRQNKRAEALACTKQGLELYPFTGRLWALRVQLEEAESQIAVLHEAIHASPKSGEIWTEAARIVMNPLSPYFNLKSARFFLNTAYLFTPQYIDLFIEMIKLEFLDNGFDANLDRIREIFLGGDGNYGTVIFEFRKLGKEFSAEEFECIQQGVRNDIAKNAKLYQRAITRSAFVTESQRQEKEKLIAFRKEYSPYLFAFGLTSFLEAMSNKSDRQTYRSVVLGSSSVFM